MGVKVTKHYDANEMDIPDKVVDISSIYRPMDYIVENESIFNIDERVKCRQCGQLVVPKTISISPNSGFECPGCDKHE